MSSFVQPLGAAFAASAPGRAWDDRPEFLFSVITALALRVGLTLLTIRQHVQRTIVTRRHRSSLTSQLTRVKPWTSVWGLKSAIEQ